VAVQFGQNPARSEASQSPTVDRGVEGEEVREEAWCTGADERKGRKEGRVAANAFYGGSVVRAERKGAQGSGVSATWRAGTGKREGASGTARITRVARIGPRPAGVGDAVAARQGRVVARERRWRERLSGGTGRRRGPVGSS
jgi:hypothetical protein